MANKPVKISIIGDASKFNKAMGSVDSGLKGFLTGPVAKMGAAIGGAFAVGKLASFGKEMFDLGSELELLDTKISTVFGDTEPEIREWADSINEKLGASETEVAGLAAGMSDLLKPMGFTGDEAANMSMEMVGLSGALSQWSAGQYSASEVSDIMTKAMLGETDGLKALGISMNAAEIDTKALAIAKADGREEITQMDKALAVQALILEKSTDAQDAYADSQDTTAAKTAEMKANIADLKESIARGLMPIFQTITAFMLDSVVPAIQDTIVKLQDLWTQASPYVMRIKDAIVGFVEDARPRFEQIVAKIREFVDGFRSGSGEAGEVAERLKGIATALYEGWQSAFEAIQAVVERVIAIVTAIWEEGGSTLVGQAVSFAKNIIEALENFYGMIKGVFDLITAIMKGDWGAAWDAIKSIVSNAVGLVKNIIQAAWDAIGFIFEALRATLKALMVKVWDGIKSAVLTGIGGVVKYVRELPGKITGALGNLGSLLKNAGRDVINGFWNGLKEKWESVKGWFTGITDSIPDFKGPLERDKTLLVENGEAIMGGLSKGLDRGWSGVANQLQGYTADIPGQVSVAGTGGAGGGINVNVQSQADPYEIAREVAWNINKQGW